MPGVFVVTGGVAEGAADLAEDPTGAGALTGVWGGDSGDSGVVEGAELLGGAPAGAGALTDSWGGASGDRGCSAPGWPSGVSDDAGCWSVGSSGFFSSAALDGFSPGSSDVFPDTSAPPPSSGADAAPGSSCGDRR